MRTRKSAEETEPARLPVLNFPLYYWATLGATDFSCAVSGFRAVQIVEPHSRKNLIMEPQGMVKPD